MNCPACNGTEFEKRGERRTYHPLGPDLEENGWNHGEVEFDTDDAGNDIIYCCGCDSEFTEAELRGPTDEADEDKNEPSFSEQYRTLYPGGTQQHPDA